MPSMLQNHSRSGKSRCCTADPRRILSGTPSSMPEVAAIQQRADLRIARFQLALGGLQKFLKLGTGFELQHRPREMAFLVQSVVEHEQRLALEVHAGLADDRRK